MQRTVMFLRPEIETTKNESKIHIATATPTGHDALCCMASTVGSHGADTIKLLNSAK